MERENCWEVLKCGRQMGGENAEKLGVCPAALQSEYDGVNGGDRSGRFCWTVVGTFCNGEVQGTFAKKLKNCLDCEFLNQVNKEEGQDFVQLSRPCW